MKVVVGRQRQQRDVELASLGRTLADFVRKAALREVVAAILVDVGEDDGRVGLERIKHAVAVMRVDIHVGDAFQAIFLLQDLDGHAGVVEHAKTGSGVGHAVVQAGDGHEKARRTSLFMIL
jgi:hypothetical protein